MISAAVALCLLTIDPVLPEDVARAECEYRERQARLLCMNYPEDCFRPETELEKAQPEFRERVEIRASS